MMRFRYKLWHSSLCKCFIRLWMITWLRESYRSCGKRCENERTEHQREIRNKRRVLFMLQTENILKLQKNNCCSYPHWHTKFIIAMMFK